MKTKREKEKSPQAGDLWMDAHAVMNGLKGLGDATLAQGLLRFFKTGPGEYGEGDRFLGIRVPVLRRHLVLCKVLPDADIPLLLASPWHEVRMFALLLWVERYKHGDARLREAIFNAYLAHTKRVNNWDLVDLSAPVLVGWHLEHGNREILYRLASSTLLWDRRIALVSTLTRIRKGDFEDALNLAALAAEDREPLMHKAAGWMLREVGKKDRRVLEAFLGPACRTLPRVLLRYSIEHFSPEERKAYLSGNLPCRI